MGKGMTSSAKSSGASTGGSGSARVKGEGGWPTKKPDGGPSGPGRYNAPPTQ